MLLWHGTKGYNLMSIFANGLIPTPSCTSHTGQAFGPGIYFADSFDKAHGYSYAWDCYDVRSKFILLCEVALGEMKVEPTYKFYESLEAPYKSIKGQGRTEPNPKHNVVLANGACIPSGEHVSVENGNL